MKSIYKISKFILIFSVILAWTFNFPPTPFLKNFGLPAEISEKFEWARQGWPQVRFQNELVSFDFPPALQQAYAAETVIFIDTTASTTWNVPSDWNNASNTIEAVGGGGGGRTGSTGGAKGGGGGGGAYAKVSNLTLSGTITIQIGTGGIANTSGTDTYFNSSTCAAASLCAKAGQASSTRLGGGFGGASSTSVGSTTYPGGSGAIADTLASGGGGGAAGLNGAGNNGNGSGSATSTGGSGDAGFGGAGGAKNATGTAGTEWDSTHGSGGGGGGSGTNNVGGREGGLYGAGAGGGWGASGAGGPGTRGLIVITYTPAAAATTYEQSAYKWYANNNSSTVGAELTTGIQDASTTLSTTGAAFRLRMLLHVTNNTSTPGVDTLKLQYASTTPGNCLPAFYGNGAFTDVATSTGEIRYNNNALPANGAIVVTTSTDPAHSTDSRVNQTYTEQNNFTATTTIGIGADGKWDFSLIDFSAPGGTTYCFQVVKSDGTFIATSTSSKIPEIKTTTAANSAPEVTSVVLNGGGAITLIPNATTSFNISYTITDTNGCADIVTNRATSTAFRSGVASTCRVPSPTTNNLNCYLFVTRATSTCSVNSINATDTVQIYYFAQSTGNTSSSFPSDNWTAYALAVDAANATGSATSSAVNINVLTAINVTTSSINYGTINASSTTGSTNQNATTMNAGNSSTTLKLSGTALTFGANSIATSSQHYATSTFTFGGAEQVLQDIATAVSGFLLPSPTSTNAVSNQTFWGLTVPAGNPTGTYSGVNTFTAVFSP